jgi:hypothetical protein
VERETHHSPPSRGSASFIASYFTFHAQDISAFTQPDASNIRHFLLPVRHVTTPKEKSLWMKIIVGIQGPYAHF